MEIREGNVRINRREMQAIKRMDHKQMEGKLTEVYETGFQDGQTAGQAKGQNWRQTVKETLEETKGIGPGRKELILERLDRKMEEYQEPRKTQ